MTRTKTKTITEQFRETENELNRFLEQARKALMPDLSNGDATIYRLRKVVGEEPTLTEYKLSYVHILYPNPTKDGIFMRKPWINKRATQKDLDGIKTYTGYLKDMYAAGKMSLMLILSPMDGSDILMRVRYPSEFCNNSMNNMYFLNKSEAAEEYNRYLTEYREIYMDREGYIPCSYCRKQIPEDEVIMEEILVKDGWGNLKKVRMPFCSEECAINESISNS